MSNFIPQHGDYQKLITYQRAKIISRRPIELKKSSKTVRGAAKSFLRTSYFCDEESHIRRRSELIYLV